MLRAQQGRLLEHQGRPPKKEGQAVVVPARLPPEMIAALDTRAAADKVRSELIRRLVEAGLPQQGAAAPSAPAPKAPPLAKLQAAAACGGLLRVIAPGGQQTAWGARLASLTPEAVEREPSGAGKLPALRRARPRYPTSNQGGGGRSCPNPNPRPSWPGPACSPQGRRGRCLRIRPSSRSAAPSPPPACDICHFRSGPRWATIDVGRAREVG